MDRTAALLAATMVLAGCGEGVGAGAPSPQRLLATEVIPPGGHTVRNASFEGDYELRLELRLRSGPPVDAWLVTDTGLAEWRGTSAPDHHAGFAAPGLEVHFDSGWVAIEPGAAHVLIEHTEHGPTAPSGDESAEVVLELSWRVR